MPRPIAICLGGATNVWTDFAKAKALVGDRPALIVACNFAGIKYSGRIDAWATLHCERFEDWKAQRAELGGNEDYRSFIHKAYRGCQAEVVPLGWYGSSGLYMAQVAREALGCSGAILCGVPMDRGLGHIHFPGQWQDTEPYLKGFEAAKADGAPIRSMSGWTARTLGEPTVEWLAEIVGEPVAAEA